jgi:hypothetical protein
LKITVAAASGPPEIKGAPPTIVAVKVIRSLYCWIPGETFSITDTRVFVIAKFADVNASE